MSFALKDWIASCQHANRRANSCAVLAAAVVATSCGSSITDINAISPISGRSFAVVTVAGRTMPTTVGVVGRFGTCDQQPVTGIALNFRTDSTLVTRFTTGDTSFDLTGSFVETDVGEVAVIAPADTARFAQDSLRLRRTGLMCARETLVAVPVK